MKKRKFISLILVVFLFSSLLATGFFVSPQKVSAQDSNTNDAGLFNYINPITAPVQILKDVTGVESTTLNTIQNVLNPTGALANQVIGDSAKNIIKETFLEYIIKAIALVMSLCLQVSALFLGLSAMLMDLVINETVFKMGAYLTTGTGLGGAIDDAWKILRDVVNVGFIFVLLYISIATILQLGSIDTVKTLRNVIIIALLINFSLFFSQVIIDTSNYLAASVYNTSKCTLENDTNLGNQKVSKSNLAACFMKPLGLTSIYNLTETSERQLKNANVDTWREILVKGLYGSTMMFIVGFVFLATALMFLFRFGYLIFLTILSPLAFTAHILPQTSSHAKKWWNKIIKESFFAPAYMIMIWATTRIVQGIGSEFTKKTPKTPSYADLVDPINSGGGVIYLIMIFILTIFFAIMSLILASNLGAAGSASAIKMGNKARGWVKGRAGASARGTIGRGAKWADDKLSKTNVGNSRVGRGLRSITTQGIAKQKWGTKIDSYKAKTNRDGLAKDIAKQRVKIDQSKIDNLEKDKRSHMAARLESLKTESGYGKVKKDRSVVNAKIKEAEEKVAKLENIINSPDFGTAKKMVSERDRDKLKKDIESMKGRSEELNKKRKTIIDAAKQPYESDIKDAKDKMLKKYKDGEVISGMDSKVSKIARGAVGGGAGAVVGGALGGPIGAASGGILGGTKGAEIIADALGESIAGTTRDEMRKQYKSFSKTLRKDLRGRNQESKEKQEKDSGANKILKDLKKLMDEKSDDKSGDK